MVAEKGRILIVDDDAETRDELRAALELGGYAVVEAENGQAAIRLLTADGAEDPSLIITDLNMPVMGGRELIAIVRSYHRLASIPLLAITGCLHTPWPLPPGARIEQLRKPFSAAQLLSAVEHSVGPPRA